MAYAYSADLWIAAHTAVLGVINGGASDPTVKIRDADDVLLATIVLDEATSAVSGTTGDLTLEILTQEDSAPASGTASYGEICDGDGAVQATFDCQAGVSPVPGYIVINTLSIVSGAPVEMLSATIPAGYTIA